MRKSTLSIALAALVLAGCGGSASNTPAADPTALVQLATAQAGEVNSTLTVYGAVEQNADSQFTLSAPVEASVARIVTPVGSPVARGQLVVALTPSPATRAEIARLAAEAQAAQQALERTERLRADGLVSDAEVESARAAAAATSASRAAVATQAGQLALRAPGAGFVQAITSNPGDLVSAGTPIVTISRTGALRARFGVDPTLIQRLSRAAGLQLEGADGSAGITVPIVAVDPSLDPQTRLSSVYVELPPGHASGAGQPLRGTLTLEQSGNAVVVPYAALLDDGGQPYVFVVQQDTAQRRDVTTGASNADSVAILSGVQAGEQLVVQGGTALEDGSKVRTQ